MNLNLKLSLKKYSDPGHGWLAVKKDILVKLNLLNDISSCSYEKGKTCYLEEDMDMTFFIKKCEGLNISLEIEDIFTNKKSPIRNYNRITKDA